MTSPLIDALDERAMAWHRDNQRHLALAAAAAAAHLDSRPAEAEEPTYAASLLAEDVANQTGRPVALDALASLFGLSGFELSLLVGTAAADLGLPAATGPVTFGRALATLPDPHWSATLPDAPLRGWRLLDLPDQLPIAELGGLSQVPLSVDERVLHGLLGAQTLDDRLAGRAEVAVPACHLSTAQVAAARTLARLCLPGPGLAPAWLLGEDLLTRREVARTCAEVLGFGLLVVAGDDLPAQPAQLDALARLLARESGLGHRLLLVESDDALTLSSFAHRSPFVGVPMALSHPDGAPRVTGPLVRVPRCDVGDRATLLTDALLSRNLCLDEATVLAFAEQHPLSAADIQLAVERAERLADSTSEVAERLDSVARELTARPLHDLATVRRSSSRLTDLVLPDTALRSLQALVATVRQRPQVHDEWGYRERGRGLAVTALFAGPSGTGKTLAAEAVAHELGRDLIAVDLSQVVSKYIGETEKNLAHLFEAAESGAVLLFDEGDALFARRTSVNNSHDRYANLEVAYLLQRLETFDGIAILTSNARENVDPAFMRRLRFVVGFPFPDAGQRATLWGQAFPAAVPTDGLVPARLAQLAVSGGTIAQLAMHATFLAADEGTAVSMRHVLEAARIECDKLERPLAASETKGWV